MMRYIVAIILAIIIPTAAQASHHKYHRHHHHRHLDKIDANGNLALAIIRTTTGLTAKVVASAQSQFQATIDAIEAAGNKIHELGCYSSGHMPGSKHHWGGACDINQRSRNRTSPFMYHVTAIIQQHGLVDGCSWHRRDCGHIEVPGPNYAARNRFAMR